MTHRRRRPPLLLTLTLAAACGDSSGGTTGTDETAASEGPTTSGSDGATSGGPTTDASTSSSGAQTEPSGSMSASESGMATSATGTMPGTGSGGGGVVMNCDELCELAVDLLTATCAADGFEGLDLNLGGLSCVAFLAMPDAELCSACVAELGATDDQCVTVADECVNG